MKLAQNISFVETEYGGVLLDGRRGKYWQLNETAAIVVKSVVQGEDLDGATRRLTEEFEVEAALAREDVEDIVGDLSDKGLLTR
ncbi:lasso peptide biosynthesis PqqD family chaperone [Sinosporangium siamense]|uniref:Lasso peptide biosynthesis PqqD family chaperone n=1 Tax=Sinosporangium siamense TaxID=1367973 RepID=A0A919V983_9ACTN|nr:lasso peptide biosynthesis PqqD family chaperone [Sinosporangium siamense]GII95026.1 hypothetical protein Ssi02_52570 [Sinosporangium siamense]